MTRTLLHATAAGAALTLGLTVPAVAAPVRALNCGGDTARCTADLQFGDGRWRAQWAVNVFHQ